MCVYIRRSLGGFLEAVKVRKLDFSFLGPKILYFVFLIF